MIRVGRFELEPGDSRASRHLLHSAWVPRNRREIATLLALLRLDAAGLSLSLTHLGLPATATDHAPTKEASLAAVQDSMRAGDAESGLSLLSASHAEQACRILFLWRGQEQDPFAVAKITSSLGAAALDREADALRLVASLPPETAAGAPRLLARAASGGLEVLVQEAVPGLSLARLHRSHLLAGRWHVALLAAAGNWLGRFHALSATEERSGGTRACAVHGDAWSRNLLVRPGGGDGPLRLTCFVDWEKFSRSGDPLEDLLLFLVASAGADLAGRGSGGESMRANREATLRWLFLPGRGPLRAVRAFLTTWQEQASQLLYGAPLAELLVGRLADGFPKEPEGTLSPSFIAELLGPRSVLR